MKSARKPILLSSILACVFIALSGLSGCGGGETPSSGGETPSNGADGSGGSGAAVDCTGTAAGTTGFTTGSIEVAGVSRNVSFYAPASRGSQPPLIIAFHGTSGSPADWITGSDPSGIEALADTKCFVVAAPDARYIPDADWDHEYGGDKYWETTSSSTTTNEDLRLVQEIIRRATATYNINPNRIYTLGFSNGGFFALLSAIAFRDQIAAFAEGGSGLVDCATTRSCTATSTSTNCATIGALCACSEADKPISLPTSGRLVPGFLAHNNRDDTVSSYYTCNLAAGMEAAGYTHDVLIGNAEGHGFPEGFLPDAWGFLTQRTLR
jgi:predicted esterase